MNRTPLFALAAVAVAVTAVALQPADKPLPQPKVVTPGAAAGQAPSDAVVLFDGTSLDAWSTPDGQPATWTLENGKPKGGSMTVHGGPVITKKKFGDCQIHIEFLEPITPGQGQDRGNSGVYIQGRYEVQVLDSFKSETYPDGQCGAIYKQHAPLVNACREPGQWQTYDIIFHGPKMDGGKKTANGTVTVLHNGVLIQDHAEVTGPTGAAMNSQEGGDGPIYLQDHGHAVQYRNVWVRPL